ncbi:hypothetical protein Sbal223_4481 (plasmid) [Shewanella baltica OS223]|uniref:DUF2913 family protein n=1 Tax=Shewanella baltica TaxID=62322 RepID=UPI0001531453|nr:DUF2913 family protein [Shewanella baltica]ACK48935.1 hypothetical protein Sbal223_4481 [Shewanella baltica OS223]
MYICLKNPWCQFFIAFWPFISVASNTTNQSFNQAKKQLLSVYQDHRETPSDTQREPDMIYMLQEHVENGFIASGEQVAPVSLFLESDKVISVVDLVNATGLFQTEIQQHNVDEKQGHILLIPNSLVQ